MKYFLLLLCLSLPVGVKAAVVINEVAWMGSSVSANYEWIELYNNGSGAVSVEGWTLDDGQNLLINLTGTIDAGKYAVLERTSEESAPGTAFLLYTGALVNTGATLRLKDKSAAAQDQVSGGENWTNIGGDNTSKDTAQYTSSGWVTDKPTPGKVNGTGKTTTVLSNASSTKTTSVVKKTSSGKNILTRSEENSSDFRVDETIYGIEPQVPTTGHVNQLLNFAVEVVGLEKISNRSARYEWNFGDSYTSTAKDPTHIYQFPGEYVVTVTVRHLNDEVISRQEVTILPVTLSLTQSPEGDWQINNDAPYDVDLSAYVLRGQKKVQLPPQTIISPKGTITIAKHRVGLASTEVELLDYTGAVVAQSNDTGSFLEEEMTIDIAEPIPAFRAYRPEILKAETTAISPVSLSPSLELETIPDKMLSFGQVDVTEQTASIPLANTATSNRWPLVAFLILLILAIGSVFYGKGANNSLVSSN